MVWLGCSAEFLDIVHTNSENKITLGNVSYYPSVDIKCSLIVFWALWARSILCINIDQNSYFFSLHFDMNKAVSNSDIFLH